MEGIAFDQLSVCARGSREIRDCEGGMVKR